MELLVSNREIDLALRFEEWNNCFCIYPAPESALQMLLVIQITSPW